MHLKPPPFAHRLSKAGRQLGIGTAAVALLALTAGTVSAAGLIEPLSSAEVASVSSLKQSSRQAIRDQLVRIDLDYLESNLVPRGIDKARDRVRQAQADGTARIELFPGVSITLDRSDLAKAKGGGFIWSGDVRGRTGGYGILIISGDQVTGQIQSGGRTYTISPVGDGVHRVSEIDMSKFPGDIVVPAPALRGAPEDAEPDTNPEAKRVIRVLIPYTPRAKREFGNVVSLANMAIALANKAAKNGGVAIKYQLAGIMKIRRYNESKKSFSGNLNDLTAGRGPFKVVHKIRNKRKADLVAMMRKSDGGLCGIGWYIDKPSKSTARYGFTVTSGSCVTYHSVTHEMGHNSGLEHDRYVVSPKRPKSQYNFGYVNVGAKLRSVMAYANRCSACTRVPMFSSSKRKYKGNRMGIRKGRPGAADAARRLNETRKAISGYR